MIIIIVIIVMIIIITVIIVIKIMTIIITTITTTIIINLLTKQKNTRLHGQDFCEYTCDQQLYRIGLFVLWNNLVLFNHF